MRTIIKTALLPVAVSLSLLSLSVNADPLYVKTAGSDSYNCKTVETACKTPWGALNKAGAGDEILIANGTYTYTNATCHYSVEKPISFIGGYNQDFSKKSNDASITKIKSNSDTGFCRFFLLGSGHSEWTTFDTLTFELSVSKGDAGAFYTHDSINAGAGVWLHLNNIIAKNFNMSEGGLVGLTRTGDRVKITNSQIENFHVDGVGAVIAVQGADGVEIVIEDSRLIGNSADSHGGVIYIDGNNSNVTLAGSVFKNNTTKVPNPADMNSSSANGAVLYVEGNKQIKLDIQDSHFQKSLARSGAVMHLAGGRGSETSIITIQRSSFVGNESWQHGSAIYAERGLFNIQNSTFSDNIAHSGGSGGPISFNGAKGVMSYSTVYNNKSGTAALGIWYDNHAKIDLFGNLIIGNTKLDGTTPADIWYYAGSVITDKGYNIVGSNGSHGIVDNSGNPHTAIFTSVFTQPTSTLLGSAANTVLKPTAYNGGLYEVWSNMPVYDGLARSRIPVADELPLFYGLGKTQTYPFVSLKQAQAMFAQGTYTKGSYYFDLGGSYDENMAFTPGSNTNWRFKTVLDDNAYLLIASSNPSANGNYLQVTDLVEASDRILTSAILAKLDFDEVRISAPNNGPRGRFDGYNRSTEAVNAVKSFKTLPNAAEPGGSKWVVTLSTSGNNYFKGNARDPGTADGQKDRSLDQEIYHSSGDEEGMHWIPSRPNEALKYPGGTPGSFADRLDLWVKIAESHDCGVSVNKDGRNMRRPGRLPGDAINDHCDIGAFEINNYYQLDCWEDDGFRPENRVEIDGVKIGTSWCFDPTNPNISMGEIMENLGVEVGRFNGYYFLLLATVLALRKKYLV